MNKNYLSVIACSLCLFMSPVVADDVTDSIAEGQSFYEEGNYSAALGSFNYVVQLITQKAAEALGQFLPPDGDGWTRGEIETVAAGASLFGGGTSSKASYSKGDTEITVTIAANSPMLQSVMMMMSNPMFLGNQKVDRVAGQRATVDFSESEGSGTINIPVAGVALVTVEGYNTTLDQMKALASKVDFKKLTVHASQ
jgi:hypothetical protein